MFEQVTREDGIVLRKKRDERIHLSITNTQDQNQLSNILPEASYVHEFRRDSISGEVNLFYTEIRYLRKKDLSNVEQYSWGSSEEPDYLHQTRRCCFVGQSRLPCHSGVHSPP